ncbi:hypothetical protein JQ554_27405 [Bradyrhizobium diazoefficiens]|nr:hypothetical protein [Bradyrhizobium diazoefficiens]MBR0967964.1 hypothetical protein [Bradyrhizobium diazoefficiens]MBR0981361.1 hypothetical protein [Bradyrhizobium diazoefficiens]MBR1010815.1 hypothetical protein [Bradyrhizobium diazoefficiens]MBR1018220.1 hypothetical protein [Bradyrhizobium diazoefficiens]MBR1054574.1 hypothetical protein [Bradyrhizobium diazoefficiens]
MRACLISAIGERAGATTSRATSFDAKAGRASSRPRAGAAIERTRTPTEETEVMAKGQQKGNRETKKPKKDKAKVIAAAPNRKDAAWQPDFGPGKKK